MRVTPATTRGPAKRPAAARGAHGMRQDGTGRSAAPRRGATRSRADSWRQLPAAGGVAFPPAAGRQVLRRYSVPHLSWP